MIWAATLRTVLIGIAKPMPRLPCWPVVPVEICEVTPMTRAVGVDQRPARVAVVDRGVGLDRVVDGQRVRRLDLPLHGADDAGRERARVAEGIADREDGISDLDHVRVAEHQRSERARVRVDLQHRRVGGRVLADDGRVDLVLAGERDLNLLRALDHVVVRDDVPGLVDHEAGAERLLLLGRRWRRAERVGLALRHARRGDLHDPRRIALIDLLGGQPVSRRLQRSVPDAAAVGDGRDLLDGRATAELAEEGCTAEREDRADDCDEQQLGGPKREDATATHPSRYNRSLLNDRVTRLIGS